MDISLREWLIILGILVILGVLLDGYRRMRSAKRNTIKLAIDKNFSARGKDERVDYFNGELPSGGARIVKRADAAEIVDTQLGDSEDQDELMPDPIFADGREDGVGDFDEMESFGGVEHSARENSAGENSTEGNKEQQLEESPQPPKRTASAPVEEVIVINVFARTEAQLNGGDLLRVVLACGMRYGEMDIFHRHEKNAEDGQLQFSMANAVKPGTFDLDNMEQFHTPGVCFFLSLPGPANSMKAFDYMLETAQCLAKNLNGELQDEQHSVMTKQTIEHSRQKIRDFERRQLSLLR